MEGAEGGRGGAALVNQEPECATFTFQRVSRSLVSHGEAWIKRGDVTHRQPAGTTGAEHNTVPHNTITDTLQHTAETNTYNCDTCGQIFLQKECLLDHVKVHLRQGSYILPNDSLFIFVTHREPTGTAVAEHETSKQNTITETLHHTMETRTYKCDTCGQIFLQKQCLIDHVKVHLRDELGTLPNECTSMSTLEHSDTTTSVQKYSCKICKKEFRKDYLKIHARYHTGEKPYTCEVCKKQFAILGNLRQHKRIHTEERPYSCNLCSKTFARSSHLKIHERSHTGEKPFTCEICNKGFSQLPNLQSHIRTHTGETPFSCTMCNNQFKQWSSLNRHKRSHTVENPWSREITIKKFRQPGALNVHTINHTNENPFSCVHKHEAVSVKKSECESSTDLGGVSEAHKETRLKEEPKHESSADSCGVSEDYLKCHARYHKGEKPYTCEVCKKQFAILHTLRLHNRIHTEERPYSCNLCAKTFARSSHLKIHQRSHTGEKPFKCEICNKRFSQLPNLQSHIRTHTGETPFSCTMCNKQFKQRSNLSRHRRSHTNKKPFSCETCKKTFRKKSSFEKHKHKAVSVKEKAECESSTDPCGKSETHKETRVKEQPNHESSADSCGVSETGASIDHVIKDELELGPEGVQWRDIPIAPRLTIKEEVEPKEEPEFASSAGCASETGARLVKDELELAPARVHHKHDFRGVSRLLVIDGEAWLKRGGVTHRQPAGTTGADHNTVPHNTITDTLQHTAETNTYNCDTCGQIFLQKECLLDHVKVHLRQGSYILPNDSLFIFEPHLNKYSCKVCKKTFRQDYLKVHARFHTGEKPFACEVCKKQFAVLDSLKVHKRIHTEERPYSCNICAKSFARRGGLKTHNLTHTGDKPFSCKICKRGFALAGNLKTHIRTHTGEKPYCCTICSKRYTQWRGLESHKRTHSEPTGTTVAEHETSKQYTITETLHHTMETCTYKCDTCGEIFLQKQCLIDHVKVHLRDELGTLPNESIFILEPSDTTTSVQKYSCKICKKKYRKEYLKIHTRYHTGEKPYTCEVCKKQFAILQALRLHKRIHTEERPYSCNLCAKTFARSSYLKIHERSHTGEKPFKCETCNKGFSQLPNLQSHIRTHTRETPFSCTMCDKQFGQWSNLNRHKRSHTVEKPFSRVLKREAVSVKEKSECESSTDLGGVSEAHKETRVKEEPNHESSADSCGVSETDVSIDHVIKDELELGPEGVQWRDIPIAPRSASPRCELFATTSGASGAQQASPPREINTTQDTLQVKIAGTHIMKQNHLTTNEQNTSKRPYTCDTCKKTFTQSGSLNTHKRIHTGEKPYSCEVCNKQFTALATFNNHKIQVHTQVKPYACEICNKGFKLLPSLKSHERIHTPGKPFPCDICKKLFRHESALRVHNRIHTGVKPYSCPICQQQFRQNGSMKAHIVHMHTREKPFGCEICKKQFASKGNLKYHIGTHAKEEY